MSSQPAGPIGVQYHPMGYVVWKHQNAIQALTSGRINVNRPGDPIALDLGTSRPWAVYVLEKNGYSWPAILDEPFPGIDEEGVVLDSLPVGVNYELVYSE